MAAEFLHHVAYVNLDRYSHKERVCMIITCNIHSKHNCNMPIVYCVINETKAKYAIQISPTRAEYTIPYRVGKAM